jgi:hypothetical protein
VDRSRGFDFPTSRFPFILFFVWFLSEVRWVGIICGLGTEGLCAPGRLSNMYNASTVTNADLRHLNVH